jgi:hypothetical protein
LHVGVARDERGVRGADRTGKEIFSLESRATHIDCDNDGPRTESLISDPRTWHQDMAISRANFKAATAIVVWLQKNDKNEAGCHPTKHTVVHDIGATIGKAWEDLKKNVDEVLDPSEWGRCRGVTDAQMAFHGPEANGRRWPHLVCH